MLIVFCPCTVGLAHQVIHGVRLVDGIYPADKMGQGIPMGSPDHPYPMHAQNQLQQFLSQQKQHPHHHHDNHEGGGGGASTGSGKLGKPKPAPIDTSYDANAAGTSGPESPSSQLGNNDGPLSPDSKRKGAQSPTRSRYQESTHASRANEYDYREPAVHATLTSYNVRKHSRDPRNISPRAALLFGDFNNTAGGYNDDSRIAAAGGVMDTPNFDEDDVYAR
jgi:hypothetical protein